MAEMSDPFSTKGRMKTAKGLSWSSWNIPEGMSESEALIRQERTRKSNRHMKHHDVEQLNRLPFEEMFLFGSHPESDVLSISQCPGCSRRYKTQWLHNYHWEVSSSGDYICSLTKAVIIPHRSSSKSDHHGHHHRESSKTVDAVHLHNASSHPHSKQNNNLTVNSKNHHSNSGNVKSSSSSLVSSSSSSKNESTKSSSKSSKNSSSSSTSSSNSSSTTSKPPLMTKAKAKMFPPTSSLPTVVSNQTLVQGSSSTNSGSSKVGTQPSSSSKSQGKLSASSASAAATGGGGSYTLSIPSEDTGQNESVESLLQSNKSYSNGSSYSSKPIQIIATAVQKSSGKSGTVVEAEYEQMKFYSDSYSEKKSKSSSGHSSHGHGHGHSHGSSSHGYGHSHGHSHSHSSKTSTNENDGTGVMSPTGSSVNSSQLKSSKTSNSTILQSVTTNPSLQNFKIPLKSKTSSSIGGSNSTQTSGSGNSNLSPSNISPTTPSLNSSKSKSKLSPSISSPHYDSHRSPLSSTSGTGISGSSCVAISSSSTHHHSSSSAGSLNNNSGTGSLAHSSGNTNAQGAGSAATSPAAYTSPGHLFSMESPVKVDAKNEDFSPPPAKKKKKKKSKNEPRKVLPLKDRLFDPDQHCGVTNPDSGIPCTRSLTCKTHSMALRRAVPGRSSGFDQLLADHKKARDAEKAAKVALEQQQLQPDLSPSILFPSSSTTNKLNPLGVAKPLSKGKLKSMDGNVGSIPSPLGASSLSNLNNTRSVPNNVPAQSSGSKTQQSLSHLQQSVTSPLLNSVCPKLEIVSETKSSLRISTASPNPNQLNSPNDSTSLMYESDEFPSRSPITGYKMPASKSGLGGASSNNSFKTGPNSSLMSPSDLAYDSSSSAYPTNSPSLKTSCYQDLGYGGVESEPVEPQIPQDPISAAIEMSSEAASAMELENLFGNGSHGFSDYGTSQNQDMGPSSNPVASPFGFNAVGPASTGYSTALHQQGQNQIYSLTNSAFSNYSAASTPGNYQTCSFHSDTTDYQGEVSVSSSGYQQQAPSLYPVPANYSSSYTTYSQAQPSLPTMYQNAGVSSRYNVSAAGNTGPTFPTSSMYPTSNTSLYSAGASSSPVYPASNPLYVATTSALFPTEPPVFSIMEDLFPEHPVSLIPPTGNHNLQIDPGGTTGSNPDGFLKPFLSGSPAATPSGILLGASSSLSLNTSSAGTSLNLIPNSDSLGLDLNAVSAFLGIGISNGDSGQTSSQSLQNDGNSKKKAQSQIKRKLLAIHEKLNNIENNPEEYLVFHDLDNTEQAFVTIVALKEPVVKPRTLEVGDKKILKTSDNDSENTTESLEFNLRESNENETNHLLKRNLIKRKPLSNFDAYVPYETQKQPNNSRNSDKGPLRKQIKLKKRKEGRLSVIPYTGEPDKLLNTSVENNTQEAESEAAKQIQITVKSLGNYGGLESGKKRKYLARKLEEEEGKEEVEVWKKQNFESDLDEWIMEPHDFHTDIFSGIRRFRMKDILRHININSNDDSSNNYNCHNNSSSLNYEKRQGHEKRPMIQARSDVPALDSQQPHSIPARDPPEHPVVHNEIESFIDTIPSIDVEEPQNSSCRQL